MKWIQRALFSMMIVSLLTLAACGEANQNTGDTDANSPAANQAEGAAEQGDTPKQQPDDDVAAEEKRTEYPLTVTDTTGTELVFDQAPERIVSTSPSETEILYALGLGDRIVAVSDYCNFPEEAQSKPKIGGVSQPNLEAVLAAEADLVVGGISMKEAVVDQFREHQLKLYKVEPYTLQDVLDNILRIGQITDTQEAAEALVAKMSGEKQLVVDAVSDLTEEEKLKVYIEFSPGWTVGKGEFMDELVTLAGGVNIASELEGWNKIDPEMIIKDNPDVIIFPVGITDSDSGKLLEDVIKERSGWSEIEAVKNDRLVGLDKDVLSRPGPRLTEGLLAMARGLYPDRFGE